MPDSSISAFGDPDDYLAARKADGYRALLIVEGGVFQAQMTKMTLRQIWLSLTEELQSRTASISLPRGLIRILPPPATGALICGGIRLRAGTLITHSGPRIMHEHLDGPCEWREIVASLKELTKFGRALTGTAFAVPSGVRLWQPPARALRALIALHAAATRQAGSGRAHGAIASHGLEQELIDRLIACLSDPAVCDSRSLADHQAEIMAQFEHLLEAAPRRSSSVARICDRLHVSDRTLRAFCRANLGMSPARYIRLRQLHQAHRDLRCPISETVTVAQIARNRGFTELGRFAATYRARYGELPSMTLHRSIAR